MSGLGAAFALASLGFFVLLFAHPDSIVPWKRTTLIVGAAMWVPLLSRLFIAAVLQ